MAIDYTHKGRTTQPAAIDYTHPGRTTRAMDMSALAGLSGVRTTPRTRVLRKGESVRLTSDGAATVQPPMPHVPSLVALSALMRDGLNR